MLLPYFLGAKALGCAVLSDILYYSFKDHPLMKVVAIAELCFILLLFGLSRTSRSEAWHTAWTDLRILAEALRPMKYLHGLGVHTTLPKLAPHQYHPLFPTAIHLRALRIPASIFGPCPRRRLPRPV